MKIGSVLENQKIENRVAITPDIVKKYISLGFEILLSENYGCHIGINDDEYAKLGLKFSKDDKEISYEDIQTALLELDENHDGEISWDEFIAWYERKDDYLC